MKRSLFYIAVLSSLVHTSAFAKTLTTLELDDRMCKALLDAAKIEYVSYKTEKDATNSKIAANNQRFNNFSKEKFIEMQTTSAAPMQEFIHSLDQEFFDLIAGFIEGGGTGNLINNRIVTVATSFIKDWNAQHPENLIFLAHSSDDIPGALKINVEDEFYHKEVSVSLTYVAENPLYPSAAGFAFYFYNNNHSLSSSKTNAQEMFEADLQHTANQLTENHLGYSLSDYESLITENEYYTKVTAIPSKCLNNK